MLTTRYTNNSISHHKMNDKHLEDKFIELAQAALEQAKMEEEQKGVLQEVFEVLIQQTGAPRVANVILEQFQSQDVIEKIAEDHFEQQQRRYSSCSTDSVSSCDSFDDLIDSDIKEECPFVVDVPQPMITTHGLFTDYLWRFFRLLILSSLVCLVYHFMCADQNTSTSFFSNL